LVGPISFTQSRQTLPSFQIAGAPTKVAPMLRLDQINSQLVIEAARRILVEALHHGPSPQELAGVVLNINQPTLQGRIVVDQPVLLPNEHFVPIELIRGRRVRRKPPSSPTV
jgi:hypothetical protein